MNHLEELFNRYPEQLTVGQAAEIFGVAPTTIYNWLQHGRIPAYKVAGSWFILREELRDLVKEGRNLPADPPPSG